MGPFYFALLFIHMKWHGNVVSYWFDILNININIFPEMICFWVFYVYIVLQYYIHVNRYYAQGYDILLAKYSTVNNDSFGTWPTR